MAQAPLSPSHSPRLPSPPPFPEVQIGPKSPGLPGGPGDNAVEDAETAAKMDVGATRRIRPGTKSADMASGPPLVPLSELDSSFQLQEHLKALYLHATRSSDSEDHTTIPVNRESATMLATPPDGVDRALWLYELCRLLVQRANSLIVGFFADSPPCSAQNCPEMRASEWQYLCAVHDPPKSCCAIDYCCHTLDWAANVLTSQKHFPSRLSLGGDAPGGSQASVRQLTNIFRRVYRMFAHAWFQHRDIFWALEGQEGLYIFYKTVCDVYQLVPEENYTVPAEAEGVSSADVPRGAKDGTDTPIVSNAGSKEGAPAAEGESSAVQPPEDNTQAALSTGATTRRHKHTPSVGSIVTTIAEGDEDSEDRRAIQGASAPSIEPSTVRRDRSSSPPKAAPADTGPVLPVPDAKAQKDAVGQEGGGEASAAGAKAAGTGETTTTTTTAAAAAATDTEPETETQGGATAEAEAEKETETETEAEAEAGAEAETFKDGEQKQGSEVQQALPSTTKTMTSSLSPEPVPGGESKADGEA